MTKLALASLLLALTSGCVIYDEGWDSSGHGTGSPQSPYGYCDSYGCYECDASGYCWPMTSADGDPCTNDDQCGVGCYCNDQDVCQSAGTCDQGCPSGFVCDDRNSCVPSGHVDPGETQPDASIPDGGDDCPMDPPPGADCACASDCQLGQYCQDGECMGTPITGPGDSCTYNGECGGGKCDDGRCHQPCTQNQQCGTGDTCQGGFCYPNPNPPVQCVFNTDCPGNHTCINAVCHPNCTTDDQCPNPADFCDQGICRPDWTRVSECVFNSDCADSEECVSGQCVTRCDTHQDCALCVDGPNCVMGYCQE